MKRIGREIGTVIAFESSYTSLAIRPPNHVKIFEPEMNAG
jgi:hypothetical protein